MANITGFTFFESYYRGLKDLEKEDRRDILEAIIDYVFEDKEPEFDGFKSTIWTFIQPNLTSSKNKSKNAQKKSKENQNKIKRKSNKKQKEINDLLENKDKDKDKNKNKNKEDIYFTNDTEINIYEKLEQNYGRTIAPIEYETLNNWLKEYSEEIVEYAIEISVLQNVRNFKYLNGILNSWKSKGLHTLQEIKNEESKLKDKYGEKSILNNIDLFNYDWLEDDDDKK